MKINIGTTLLCLLGTGAIAQQVPLTLEQAVQQAMSKYPAVTGRERRSMSQSSRLRPRPPMPISRFLPRNRPSRRRRLESSARES